MQIRRLGTSLVLMVASMSAGTVRAQEVVSTFDELRPLQSANATVIVTDTNGQRFRGTIADASRTAVSLRMGSAIRQFAAANIRSIDVRRDDSLGNGTVIGAAVGGGLSSLIFLDNECHHDAACYTAVAVYTGIGALAGLGIDALIHRSVPVYKAPGPGAPPVVRIAPLVSAGRTGVRLTVAF